MPEARRPCPWTLPLLLLAAAYAHADDGVRVAVVAPDVEIVADGDCDGPVVPSAAASDGFARAWPRAVAAAMGSSAPVAAWVPSETLDDASPLAQALALQNALADAVVAGDVPASRRELTLGGAADAVASATGATHAAFVRVRAGCAAESSVAMLVDLRDGHVLGHAARRRFDERAEPAQAARELAAAAFADRGLAGAPLWTPGDPSWPPLRSDAKRAIARYESSLHRNPSRVDAPELEAYVLGVACRLDAGLCAGLRVHVLRDPGLVGRVFPGGLLLLHSGLLLHVHDEAELAFLLAHELAHRRADDAARQRDAAASRVREKAMDREALALLDAAGYDTAAASRFWRRLLAEDGETATDSASHPPYSERIANLATLPATRGGTELGTERWETAIAPYRQAWLAGNAGYGAVPVGEPPADAGASAPTGDTRRVLGLQLRSPLRWTRHKAVGAELWTVDGFELNRLLIVSGLPDGERILRAAAATAPRWTPGLAPGDIAGRTLQALHTLGWQGLQAPGLRRHAFGDVPGWRAELAGAGPGGLRHRGAMAFAVRGGRLTLLIWLAPEGHYHDRDAASVAATLDGLRFAD